MVQDKDHRTLTSVAWTGPLGLEISCIIVAKVR